MTQKIVTITIKDLDITQLMKCAQAFKGSATMSRGCVNGAYNYELYEFVSQLIDAGYAGEKEITATCMNI
jgi:hypothetical protein